MAYVSQELKAKIAPRVKAILNKYKLKGSLSVRNHMTLCLTIKEGSIDFFSSLATPRQGNYLDVNTFWIHDHFTGKAKTALLELKAAMNDGNHDRSDIQSDYFDVGWYIDITVGRWNKPYILK